jgi:PAS domain S-box-containing protein
MRAGATFFRSRDCLDRIGLRVPPETVTPPVHTSDVPRPESAGDIDLYRLLVESVRDYAIFLLDPEGNVMSWNPGAERFKGYKAHEIIGKHFSVFYPEEDKWKPSAELEIAKREGRVEDEGWRLRKDGSRFWASIVITALHDKTGKLVGFAKVTRDLTERKLSEERAIEDARSVALSDAANRAKAEFLAAMSHELRTPLNAIAGYADLLLAGVGGGMSKQQMDYMERIRRSQQRLLSIINDILNFSRVEAGQITYETEAIPVAQLVDATIPLVQPQATFKNVTITRDPDLGLVVCADRTKVEQVLLNLLANAVKFTPPAGTITVCAAPANGMVRISVEDTGIGIAPADLKAIFQPFVQVGRSLSSGHEGTGLGLAISSDLAKGMHGRLEVESIEGKGSTFTLVLPIDLPKTKSAAAGSFATRDGQAPSSLDGHEAKSKAE